MLTHREIEEVVVRDLKQKGYKIELGVNIYKEFSADILAEKEGKKSFIEIKSKRDDILSSLINSKILKGLPNISYIYLAIPSELLEEDVKKIAQYIGFGLYKVAKEGIIDEVHARELPQASLEGGGGYPSFILPGQIFEVRANLAAREKIVPNITVSYLPGGPFSVPSGESNTRKIDELKPGDRIDVAFKVRVNEDTKPGKYPLFIVRTTGVTPLDVNMYEIEVKEKTSESIKQEVRNAVATLNYAMTTNIENILSRIDEATMTGIIDIKENIIDKSVWNDIGIYCINNGLYRQAELVYRKMLETIQKCEKRNNKPLHKGLALHNLGVALYQQGKKEEAKQRFLEAREEDRRTYGHEEAKNKPAQTALTQLFGEPIT